MTTLLMLWFLLQCYCCWAFQGSQPVKSSRDATASTNVTSIEYASTSCTVDTTTALMSPTVENSEDDFFRTFRRNVPVKIQYLLRDSGFVRTTMNSLVLLGVPTLINQYPSALHDFFALIGNRYIPNILPKQYQSKSQLDVDFNVSYIPYGDDKRQFYSLIRPTTLRSQHTHKKNRLVVFVHGGAWGSGWPGMYQLTAIPFINSGYDFAVIGYRTYPSTDVRGQIDDLNLALKSLRDAVPNTQDVTLIAHSSGAHITSLGFLNGQIPKAYANQYISLSGLFDIPSHYLFEKSRGVERISPMAAACGLPGQRLQGWKDCSPLRISQENYERLPESLFIHGDMDTTAPYTSSIEFSSRLKQSELRILPVGHAETVLQIMFGGVTRDVVLDWINGKVQEY